MQLVASMIDKIRSLPEEKQREVFDFVLFLEHQTAGGCPSREGGQNLDAEAERHEIVGRILASKPIDIRPYTVRDLIEDGRER